MASTARILPTQQVAYRRARAANGRSVRQTVDTIGKLWAQGLLDGSRFTPEHLRDAGRRYATLYWYRLGPCCASTANYGEFVSKGANPLHIANPEKDRSLTDLYERRVFALDGIGRVSRQSVEMFCVDGQGDNDPWWLTEIIMGLPNQCEAERKAVEQAECDVDLRAPHAPYKFRRRLREARKQLRESLKTRRIELIPQMRVEWLLAGLEALAEIDKAEGRHDRQRQRRTRGGAWDALASEG